MCTEMLACFVVTVLLAHFICYVVPVVAINALRHDFSDCRHRLFCGSGAAVLSCVGRSCKWGRFTNTWHEHSYQLRVASAPPVQSKHGNKLELDSL